MTERLRALRGATTLDADTEEQVIERTATLLTTMMDRNGVSKADLVSIVFTATEDIHAEFPAAAARKIGMGDVPLLCARELQIMGAVGLCIRVMMHLYTEKEPTQLRHVYLEGAVGLRDDLPE